MRSKADKPNLKIIEIGDGDEAIYKTVEKMLYYARRDASDPKIRKIADRIWEQTAGDDVRMAQAVFDYVYKNIEYEYDHEGVLKHWDKSELADYRNTEFLKAPKYLADPDESVVENKGDCDDMTMFICAIAKALGMRCRMRIIAWKPNTKNFTHVYAELGLDSLKVWIPADPVIKEFGQEKAPVHRAKSFEV